MKLSSLIAARPVSFFILLTIVVLVLPAVVIPCWIQATKQIDRDVKLNTKRLRAGVQSEIEDVGKLLTVMNSSASNLARLLDDDGKDFSFNKVSQRLFQAFSTIPFVSQISYIARNGDFFSYHTEGNQVFASYSNTSFSFHPNNSESNRPEIFYIQPVDRMTGRLYGEAVKSAAYEAVNTTWFQASLNSSEGYASLGDGWDGGHNSLILNSAGIYGRAVLSIGFPVKALTKFLANIDLFGGKLYLATADGEVLMEGIPNTQMGVMNDSISIREYGHGGAHAGDFQCSPAGSALECAGVLPINGTHFNVLCSKMKILGVQLVYALLLPHQGLASLVQKNGKLALILLTTMITAVIISVFSFVLLMVRAARREIHLCAKLIKQMESTQQAERKNMNKSLFFATNSHNIRAALAGITSLIRISKYEVTRGSQLEWNLEKMQSCAKDLVGLLNSILDVSKIEAGKMQLEEEEFNLAELLEQIVDERYPVGMEKGVDMILDPYDGSILKFPKVRGDRGKLKQVLINLLSNAEKFTSNGHIAIRSWVQKPSLESAILASNQCGGFNNKCISFLFSKNKEARNDMEAIATKPHDPNSMEFVFEVEDTGKGIPKEKWESVFENFVQVDETKLSTDRKEANLSENEEKALNGTGLGLGSVQSLVRLMGGDIRIVDKQDGERGTCFRFNVFFTLCDVLVPALAPAANNYRGKMGHPQEDTMSSRCSPYAGLTIRTPARYPSLSTPTLSPKLSVRSSSPRLEGSHSQVVLLIQNSGRRRILQKYIESLGVNVMTAERREQLAPLLERIKFRLIVNSPHNSARKTEIGSKSDLSSVSSKDHPLSAMDGTDQKLPLPRKKGILGFILLVIDAGAGSSPKIAETVSEFRTSIKLRSSCNCKVVWLDNPTSRNIDSEDEKWERDDDILLQPFHGSRLFRVLNLLPEIGGKRQPPEKVSQEIGSSSSTKPQQCEIQVEGDDDIRSPRIGKLRDNSISSSDKNSKPFPHNQSEIQEIREIGRPLSGKRILVVDDDIVQRRVAHKTLKRDGAIVEDCTNGEEALNLICNGLGTHFRLPYDFILMDREMPVMDGLEATRRIREAERGYGVHMPIILLSADVSGEEISRAMAAGLDFVMQKPLDPTAVAEAIISLANSMENY